LGTGGIAGPDCGCSWVGASPARIILLAALPCGRATPGVGGCAHCPPPPPCCCLAGGWPTSCATDGVPPPPRHPPRPQREGWAPGGVRKRLGAREGRAGQALEVHVCDLSWCKPSRSTISTDAHRSPFLSVDACSPLPTPHSKLLTWPWSWAQGPASAPPPAPRGGMTLPQTACPWLPTSMNGRASRCLGLLLTGVDHVHGIGLAEHAALGADVLAGGLGEAAGHAAGGGGGGGW